jgi:hypothetical protein
VEAGRQGSPGDGSPILLGYGDRDSLIRRSTSKMPKDHRLYELSDAEFEGVVVQICVRWLGQGVTPFAPGRDGGKTQNSTVPPHVFQAPMLRISAISLFKPSTSMSVIDHARTKILRNC